MKRHKCIFIVIALLFLSCSRTNKLFDEAVSLDNQKKYHEAIVVWNKLIQNLHHNGSILDSPLMTLSYMALNVIHELKIGERGLFEYSKFKFLED